MKDCIRDFLTAQFGDDPSLQEELYAEYRRDMNARVRELPTVLAAGAMSDLADKAHAMKGMALAMGDQDMTVICVALQQSARQGNAADCAVLVPRLVAECASLK